jgi:hypothetical protein
VRGFRPRRALGQGDGRASGDPACAEILKLLLAALLAAATSAAAAPAFVFATVEEARSVLAREDDYLLATTGLERRARLRSAQPVERAEYAAHMAAQALAWPAEERRRVEAMLAQIAPLLDGMSVSLPERILMIRVAPKLEDGAPHTRANAIVLPATWLSGAQPALMYVLTHELFHVLSRHDRAARERLYAAIGFHPCVRVEVPSPAADLRVTNPDAVEHRHAIRVRYRGEPLEAMPYPAFTSAQPDLAQSFFASLQMRWLLIERDGERCRARAAPVNADELEGLYEQIGRNTNYLAHPEEIVADNFALLLMRQMTSAPGAPPSPDVLERIRAALARR